MLVVFNAYHVQFLFFFCLNYAKESTFTIYYCRYKVTKQILQAHLVLAEQKTRKETSNSATTQ